MSEELKNDESLDNEYEDAWDEAVTAQGDDTDDLDTDEADDEQDDSDDDAGSDDESTDEESDGDDKSDEQEVVDEKELQRRKSWEGRIKAEEERLKAEREKFETEKKERAEKAKALLADNDDDTDWEAVAEELEMPELAKIGKDLQKVKQFQKLQLEEQEAAEAQAQKDAEEAKRQEQEKAQKDHFDTILKEHSTFFDDVQSTEFAQWEASQDEVTKQGIAAVKARGNAQQVIQMMNAFKASRKPKPSSKPEQLAGVKRGAKKPRAEVDKNDYDSAWDEAIKS